jgi:hypothetical protein
MNNSIFLIPPALGPCIGSIDLIQAKDNQFELNLNFWVAFEYSERDFIVSDLELYFRYRQINSQWKTMETTSVMSFPPKHALFLSDTATPTDDAKLELSELTSLNGFSLGLKDMRIPGGYTIIKGQVDEIKLDINSLMNYKNKDFLEIQIFLKRENIFFDNIFPNQVLRLDKTPDATKWNDEIDCLLAEDTTRRKTADQAPSAPPWMSEELTSWSNRATVKLAVETFDALVDVGSGVRFISASCRHPGMGLDEERVNESLQRAANSSAAFALLVGDQIYADATAGLNDPINPIERYVEEHAKAFGPEGYGRLTRKMPVYFAADDHEWRDDYPNGIPLDLYTINSARYKSVADHAISAFQYSHVSTQSGLSYQIENYHLLDIFVFDTRSKRQGGGGDINSPNELKRLIDWIKTKSEPQKLKVLVSGSVFMPGLFPDSDVSKPGYLDTTQLYPKNRLEVLSAIADASEQGHRFLLLSGDYHLSGFFALKCNEKTIGACTIVPPWYAPWLFSNSSPYQVMDEEEIELAFTTGDKRQLKLESIPGGELLSGNGFSEFTVEPFVCSDGQAFKISIQRYLHNMTLPGAQYTLTPRKSSLLV